jgi:hypothetical protein
MGIPNDVRDYHQAATSTQLCLTSLRHTVSYYYSMESGVKWIWQTDREMCSAGPVQEQAIRMGFDPPLGTPDLHR